ncbi:hypothetical protein [Paracraurococcus ruber]|uniref:Uncharacterized protein n=1 Tax=Paracraurococcus ruber TaxID=77675 RepID=A0ABS1CUL5_9PROT|nr:hypothetical protein [Paracraurococcus ruber]MBK1658184.1 hypothetical protein [Paracraurococcus ruber]TDG31813.1 hypothetical protein E2C05_09590 [Paracraurococcus ruber]
MAERGSRLAEALRHPLCLALVSFLLTGVLANLVSRGLDQQARERDREAELRAYASRTITEVTELIFERLHRAELVGSSVIRRAPVEEIKERKRSYDEAYLRWNIRLAGNQQRLAALLGPDRLPELRAFLDVGITQLFRLADACLTDAYDLYLPGTEEAMQAARRRVEACEVETFTTSLKDLHDQTGRCGRQFAATLYAALAEATGRPAGRALTADPVLQACLRIEAPPPR